LSSKQFFCGPGEGDATGAANVDLCLYAAHGVCYASFFKVDVNVTVWLSRKVTDVTKVLAPGSDGVMTGRVTSGETADDEDFARVLEGREEGECGGGTIANGGERRRFEG
jgi:hypothetical protein